MNNSGITKQNVEASVHDAVNTDSELYKVGAIVTSAFAAMVGVWGVVCLSSAFMAEGPMTLVKNLFGAISGTM